MLLHSPETIAREAILRKLDDAKENGYPVRMTWLYKGRTKQKGKVYRRAAKMLEEDGQITIDPGWRKPRIIHLVRR